VVRRACCAWGGGGTPSVVRLVLERAYSQPGKLDYKCASPRL